MFYVNRKKKANNICIINIIFKQINNTFIITYLDRIRDHVDHVWVHMPTFVIQMRELSNDNLIYMY